VSKGYKALMELSGAAAAGLGLIYLVVMTIAVGDGLRRGIEVPAVIGRTWLAVIMILAVFSGGAWIVDRSAKDSAIRDLKPLIRAEIDLGVAEAVGYLAEAVAEQLAVKIEPMMETLASASVARQTATLREIVTGDTMQQMLNDAVGRAHRAGMLHQAQATANGNASVTRLARYNTNDS